MIRLDVYMPILDFGKSGSLFSKQVVDARRFFLPKRTGTEELVCGGGFERVRSDYKIERQGMPFVGVEFVVGGGGRVTLSGVDFALTPGTFFIYSEGSPHRLQTDPQRRLAKYFVDLSSRAGRKVLTRLKIKTDRAWLTRDPSSTARLFEEMLRHGTSAAPRREEICDALLTAILLQASHATVQGEGKSLAAFETYQRCCKAIEEDAIRIRSLSELADVCGVDEAYVCRLFRRFDRQTPYQRLLRRRLDHAASRLYGSDVLVKAIADELGFADPFHFSRSFKSVYGQSPEVFRRTYIRPSP